MSFLMSNDSSDLGPAGPAGGVICLVIGMPNKQTKIVLAISKHQQMILIWPDRSDEMIYVTTYDFVTIL